MKQKDNIEKLNEVVKEVSKVIVGRKGMIERIIMGILADGHILLEGVPGTAKTLTISALSKALGGKFKRVQMIPDMLPSDIVGSEIYVDGKMEIQHGPLSDCNLVLVDEINRAPAKTQAALLEAMQERQITILGKETFPLKDPFVVLATQNPIEQEGVYPLPEAQIDRFLIKIIVPYNTKSEEIEMAKNKELDKREKISSISKVSSMEEIIEIREDIKRTVQLSDVIYEQIVDIVDCTRNFEREYSKINKKFEEAKLDVIKLGASPRAVFALKDMARVRAYMVGREYVYPEDIKKIIDDVLRHRIHINFKAESKGWTAQKVINLIKKMFF